MGSGVIVGKCRISERSLVGAYSTLLPATPTVDSESPVFKPVFKPLPPVMPAAKFQRHAFKQRFLGFQFRSDLHPPATHRPTHGQNLRSVLQTEHASNQSFLQFISVPTCTNPTHPPTPATESQVITCIRRWMPDLRAISRWPLLGTSPQPRESPVLNSPPP